MALMLTLGDVLLRIAQIRQYTGSQHTYVLTAMFQFSTILGHFRNVLGGIQQDDVAYVKP